ncbi:hypothetical protein BD779DRAFT_1527628 [Infundibulicybe gibba]|nr:hypothetical protein BD779DRAFT_1527628 [Infundibulicybe gibba]
MLCHNRWQIAAYFNVASVAVLIYDWFVTLDSEITLIWNPRWNFGTLLYFLTRYPAFIDTALYMHGDIGYAIPVPICGLLANISSWMFLFGFGISEVIMMICVWAMWGRRRRMAIAFTILGLTVIIACMIEFHSYHGSQIHIPPEMLPRNTPGCQTITKGAHDIIFAASEFIALAILESVLSALLFYKAILHSRNHPSTFVSECFRHGLLYYAVLGALSIANLSIIFQGAPEFDNLLTSIQRSIHAILSARMLLHLKCSTRQNSGGTISLSGEIRFPVESEGSIGNFTNDRERRRDP